MRVVGSGLSPNGMAFSSKGMLSTALLDKVISVDKEKQQVTVQAGARVQQVMQVQLSLRCVRCAIQYCRTRHGSSVDSAGSRAGADYEQILYLHL